MDRLIRLKSESDLDSSSSYLYQTADEDSDSSLYYSVNEDTVIDKTLDFKEISHSVDLKTDDTSTVPLPITPLIGSSTPKGSTDTNSVLSIEYSMRIGNLFNSSQFGNNLMELPLPIDVSDEDSIQTQMDIVSVDTIIPEPEILSKNESSRIASVVENVPGQMEPTDINNFALADMSMLHDSNTEIASVVENVPSQMEPTDINNFASTDMSMLHDSNTENNMETVTSTADVQQLSSNDPMLLLDSTASSSLVRLPSTGVIPKATRSSNNGKSHSNSVLTPWNAISHKARTPRKTPGKYFLTKPPSMYASSIPTGNKRVTLNVNMVMPSGSSRLANQRKSTLRKSPMKKLVSAGPSGLIPNKFKNPTVVNVCEICNKSFDLKITLMEHKLKHFENESNNCKYCDYKFKKAIALLTHLKENCSKIPAAERRKIFVDEFNKLSWTSQDKL